MKRLWVLGLLIVLFAAPGILAYIIYAHPQWLTARTNHGQLLQPPIRLQGASPEQKWQLFYWRPQGCAAGCDRRIDELAKMRLALGRRLYYVDLMVGVPAAQVSSDDLPQKVQTLLKQVGGAVVQINATDGVALGSQPAIYIVNPQHYAVLAYAEAQPLKDIFQDLQKLVHDK